MHIQPITRSQDESSELCEVHCLAGFLCFWCLRLFGLMRRTCETTGGARLFSEGSRHTSDSVLSGIFSESFSFSFHSFVIDDLHAGTGLQRILKFWIAGAGQLQLWMLGQRVCSNLAKLG